MKLPEYVLMEPWEYDYGSFDKLQLPVGAFVQPINEKYVPQHVKDDKRWSGSKKNLVYCYTRYGILLLPESIIRKIG